jgi:hypothetical protein
VPKTTKRAALYVRVSTDHQSVDSQIQELGQIAERRGWIVVATYRDAGISGGDEPDQEAHVGADTAALVDHALLDVSLASVAASLSRSHRGTARRRMPRRGE